MAIEKNSSGLPEIDVRKKTTKVNLAMMAGVGIFFLITVCVVIWLWASHR